MKIFIDAGHGGADSGAVNGSLKEKNMTLVCAKAAEEFLKKYNQTVKLSRTGDVSLSLTERATMANNWGADIFVSCHFNAGGGNRGEVIHSVNGGKGEELAKKIATALKNAGQETVKTYSRTASSGSGDYFTVIAKTKMPAVIVEPCFIDSFDRTFADTEEKQKKIGKIIAKGILNFFDIDVLKEENYMELTSINDIVYELKIRGIISDTELWLKKLEEDKNSYFLAKKAVDYIRKAEI